MEKFKFADYPPAKVANPANFGDQLMANLLETVKKCATDGENNISLAVGRYMDLINSLPAENQSRSSKVGTDSI